MQEGSFRRCCEAFWRDSISDNGKATSDVITSTILIDSYFKNGDKIQALAVWNDMFQKNVQIDVAAYNVIINGFCLSGDISFAYASCQMLKRGSLPDVITYNTLLSGLCKQGKLDEACYVHGVMQKTGVAPDQISYKTIIKGLCIHGDVVKAREFLLSMLEKSVVPEPLIWDLIIDGYGRCGDLKNALSIRDLMLSFGVSSSVFTFNALIHAETKGGNSLNAISLKNEMLLGGIFPDIVTYNLLIGASCNLGHIHLALRLYDEILRMGIAPDIITYTELIKGHCVRGNMKEAEEVFAKIQTLGLAIDHIPFRILKNNYCRMKEPDKARYIHKKWLSRKRFLLVGPANAIQQCTLSFLTETQEQDISVHTPICPTPSENSGLELSLIATPSTDVDDDYTRELAIWISYFVHQDDKKTFISTTDFIYLQDSEKRATPLARLTIGGKLEQHRQGGAQIPL